MTDTSTTTLVQDRGTSWVRVPDVDRIPPFLVSVVSPSDHWLYASSAGGLAAGRVDAEGSLFPYMTDDKLHRAQHDVGSWTALRVRGSDGQVTTWEPIRPRNDGGVTRTLLKSVEGDRLVLQEDHTALGLRFAVEWGFSDRFGIVRGATLSWLEGGGPHPVEIELVDGLQGLLPANAPLSLTQSASCLVHAYTRCEWDPAGRMAILSMEAQPSDRAEPAESLRATVAWCAGLPVDAVLLSRDQLDAVAGGAAPRGEQLVTGRPGAFLVSARLRMEPGDVRRWAIVADVQRSHHDLAALRRRPGASCLALLDGELEATRAAMRGILADADGLQISGDLVYDVHHRANALFNAMRGGLPVDEHRVSAPAFRAWVVQRNRACHERHPAWFDALGDGQVERAELIARAEGSGDPDLRRLAREYIPLWFGRRHGDPSRPWNRFTIRVLDERGDRRVAWEGNWRDVFQNWEALLHSYPEYLDSAVAVFVNASTRDGYNPYRIGSEGIDWERPDPEDPWSNLGYWGDHQIVYLSRLIEASLRHHPDRLPEQLLQEVFTYADVPYRLRSHAELVANPRDSVAFDEDADRAVEARVERLGADGRLVPDGAGLLHVNLAEKLLVPVLAKLCTLVPGAGLWLNTQRPEWNDANNALAGWGVSVVTAAHLWRHLELLSRLFDTIDAPVRLTAPVGWWLDAVLSVLHHAPPSPTDTRSRRCALDALGLAAEHYRGRLREPTRHQRGAVDGDRLRALCHRGKAWLQAALEQAERPDGLYDGYVLLELPPDTLRVKRLQPMLEGQVAMLSSGLLPPARAAALVERLYDSELYRADVHSFLLYPARPLPSFMDRNRVPEPSARALPPIAAYLEHGEGRLLGRDAEGALRFMPELSNAADLAEGLRAEGIPEPEHEAWFSLWEETFEHHAFTGRSGTMYAYEGLGSVYWHMVGKLLLAVQEAWRGALDSGADEGVLARLEDGYHRVRAGLGFERDAAAFGGIPTDPYSHTPAGRGAQQPGMTGLVKEELLARRGELGLRVRDGALSFEPRLLRAEELLVGPERWEIPAGARPGQIVELPTGGLGFLLCGVPVIYRRAETSFVRLHGEDGVLHHEGTTIDAAAAAPLFRRSARLRHIEVGIPGLGRARRRAPTGRAR